MFYSRLESVCCAQGLSVAKACVKAGLHRSSYLAWKHGHLPSRTSLSKMSVALGVAPEYLQNGGGESASA